MASTTEIQNSINKGKCCFGNLTCNAGKRAQNGFSYKVQSENLKQLKLYLFSLEQYLIDLESVSYASIEIMISFINHVCTDCYATTSTSVGEHTTYEHTEEDHTK